jgi:hypothetical protein
MALTLSKIANNTSTVTIAVDGEQLTITYYPSRVTEKTFAELQSFANMSETKDVAAGFASLNDILARLIKSWDLYEDDEQTVMYPLTAERLAELPIILRTQIIWAVMGDIRPEAIAPQTLN